MSFDHGNSGGSVQVLGFDLLPALNEGDERCSLSDLLTWRDDALTDPEIWAVCRECCLALTSVQRSPDMFQSLCITPDTLAFDASGAVCLLDLCDHEGNLVYLAPEFDSLGNSFKAHMFSLGMTLLYAAEYNASSSKQSPMDPDLSALVHSMTKEDFDSRCALSEALNACDRALSSLQVCSEEICRTLIQNLHSESSSHMSIGSTVRLGSQSSLSNTSPRWQSSGSSDSLALPPSEFMDDDPKRLIRESKTEKLKDSVVRTRELGGEEFIGVDNRGSGPPRSSDFRVSVSCICDELDRGLEEQEAWALCHQAVCALKSTKEDYPYICMDTVVISASTGNVKFLAMPDDKELDITFLAPELQQQAIVTPNTCLYGVGALLWAATDYKTTKGQTSLSSQMEMLLIIMTQNEADARPSLDEVREICEDQEKIASFKSQSVCLELAAQIQLKRHQTPEILERPMSPLPEFTPHEKVVMEIRAGKYKLRKSSKPKVLSPQEIFMNDKDLMQSLQNVAIQRTTHASAFKPIDCTNGTDIVVPSAFQSPKTHFKPIVLKQHKQNAKLDKRKTKSSNSLPNIETPVDELKEETSLQGTNGSPNLSSALPYQVQLQHDPKTGFYQVIPVMTPPRASSQPLMVSPAPSQKRIHSEGLVVTQSLITKAEERDDTKADKSIQSKNIRTKSSSSVNAPMQLKTFDIGLNNDQPMSKSHPNLDILEDNGRQVQRPRRRRGDHCFSPDLPLSPVPSPSLSKDSGVSGIHLKGCGDPAQLERLLDSQNLRHNRRLQQVIRVVRDEFAFDGYMENGIEDVQMAEYIMSLCGLRWDTFVSAISEKFIDLYWEEGILISLFECVNGCKPMPTEEDYPESPAEDILPLPSPRPEPQPIIPEKNQVSTAAWDGTKKRKERERAKSTQREQKHKSPTRFRQNSVTPQEQFTEENELLADVLNEHPSSPDVNSKRNIIFVKSSSVEDNVDDDEHDDDEEDEDTPRSSPPPRPSHSLGSSDCFPMMRSHKVSFSAEDPEEFAFDSDDESTNHVTIIRNSKSIWGDIHQISRLKIEEPVKPESPREERRISHVICSSTDNSDNAVDVMPDTCWQRVQGSDVIYHWVELLQRSNIELNGFMADMENSNKETIELTMCDIDQEFAMEQRNRKRTFNYYRKLLAASKKCRVSSEQRGMLSRVIQELSENKDRLEFLELARKHLETMYAECFGIEPSVLLALINCSPKEPMLLSMADANPHLQVQMDMDGKRTLQTATSEGLMASLFAKGALSNGFIHQFFYGFRYFVAPLDLLSFICDKYAASSQSLAPAVGMPAKVKVRAIDLLQAWLEGYFSIDFRNSRGMLQTLKTFLKSREEDDCLEKVRLTLELCMKGQNYELVPTPDMPSLDLFQNGSTNNLKPEVKIEADVEWENFQYSLALGKKCSKTGGPLTTAIPLHRPSGLICSKKQTRKTDAFNLADFTAQHLAEQLTLMEQGLFSQAHPAHYLNTRAQGISVHLAHPVLSRTQSISMMHGYTDDRNRGNLFVGSHHIDDVIQQLIEHAQSISYWVSAEILSCTSAKEQINVIHKFISAAHHCHEMRNFASAIAIVESLENLLVRQLPSWKSVPSKCNNTLQELSSFKLRAKSDVRYLIEDTWWQHLPTIPCILYFLIHLQQMEIGSFTLVSGMVKWAKIRAIANQVDFIRVFKQNTFTFEPDPDLHSAIKERIRQFGQHDLQVLASQHPSNYRRSRLSDSGSRAGSLSGTFRRLRNMLNGRQTDS